MFLLSGVFKMISLLFLYCLVYVHLKHFCNIEKMIWTFIYYLILTLCSLFPKKYWGRTAYALPSPYPEFYMWINTGWALASLVALLVYNLPAMWEIWVRSLGWEDPLEKGKGYPLQYSGLENSMDIHGIAKSQTRLSDFDFHFPVYTGVSASKAI